MTETQQTPSAEGGGTEMTRFNALRHGVLSRYTVLPWEDADEYRALQHRADAKFYFNQHREVASTGLPNQQ